MNIKSLFVVVAALVLSGGGHASELASSRIASPDEIVQTSPQISAERSAQLGSALVRSFSDLEKYLAAFGDANSAFAPLSTEAQSTFFQSLKFSEKGLSSSTYRVLESELTPTQIYKVLSIFGMQHLTAKFRLARIVTATDAGLIQARDQAKTHKEYDETDYPDYACTARATCGRSLNDICTGNC